jgi:hypothetical protein
VFSETQIPEGPVFKNVPFESRGIVSATSAATRLLSAANSGGLRIQLPWPTEIINTINCLNYEAAERELHEWFKDKRTNGEWFLLDKEDVSLLEQIYFIDGNTPAVYGVGWYEM